jgi:hypothetical protein
MQCKIPVGIMQSCVWTPLCVCVDVCVWGMCVCVSVAGNGGDLKLLRVPGFV